MHALIFGPPGSGKGTYGEILQKKLGIDLIAMGNIFRAIMKENSDLGRKVKSYMEAGLLVPDEIVVEVLQDCISGIPEERGFILDGFPRTIAQAEALEKITRTDVVLQLVVPDWIIVERLSSRRICKNCGAVYNLRFLKPKADEVCDKCGGQLYQRKDDNPQVIKIRLHVYERETSPLVRYYKMKKVPFIVHRTDSLEVPPEAVVEYFIAELNKLNLT